MKSNEKSERAFELTRDAALLNPANYTVWYYRRKLVVELKKDLRDELEFITNVIRSHPKNYQVWQHRRTIVDLLNDASEELTFTQQIIKRDSKNYHAWQYRQWAIKRFGLWSDELTYVNELIGQDIRNNSAWNQRYFCLVNINKEMNERVIGDEIEYCLDKIDVCIDNESSWNYLRAMLALLNTLSTSSGESVKRVSEFCERKLTSSKEDERSPFLYSFVVDQYITKAEELVKVDSKEEIKSLVIKSIELLDKLATKYDTIRANYWNYLIATYKQQFSKYSLVV